LKISGNEQICPNCEESSKNVQIQKSSRFCSKCKNLLIQQKCRKCGYELKKEILISNFDIDPFKDDCLHASTRENEEIFKGDFDAEPPTSGIDLYAHQSKTGRIYFYMYRWKKGIEPDIEFIEKSEMKSILQERRRLGDLRFEPDIGRFHFDDDGNIFEIDQEKISISKQRFQNIQKHFPDFFAVDSEDFPDYEEFFPDFP